MKKENSINQIITALLELEAKGYHHIFFEYGNGLLKVRIFKGDVKVETIVYERTIDLTEEQAILNETYKFIENLKNHVQTTIFQCYRQVFRKNEYAGQWEKVKPSFEFGENATSEMLIDGSGYYITDPDNGLQYFVDMKQESKTN